MLHRIVYFSRNTMSGSSSDVLAGVQQILATARRNNARVGVTGALVFNSGGFAQVLEGPRQGVAEIFERIQCDRRHSDVLVLEHTQVETRSFASWSMAFIGRNLSDDRLFGAISKDSGFDPESMSTAEIFQAMNRLVLEEETAA
jgi:hypothetical protein